MIYWAAAASSLIACLLSFAHEATTGNTLHVQYGRPPNAGAAIFPTIPLFQFVFVGMAWIIQFLVPSHAIAVLTIFFVVILSLQTVSLWKAIAKWKQVSTKRQ